MTYWYAIINIFHILIFRRLGICIIIITDLAIIILVLTFNNIYNNTYVKLSNKFKLPMIGYITIFMRKKSQQSDINIMH